jgi:polyisoprenoid-binding protein YceI
MSRIVFLLLSLIIFLVSCTSQSATPQIEPPSTLPETDEALSPTSPPPQNDLPTPDVSESESGLETFLIVPEESEVAYEVGEVFLNQDNRFNIAIGITNQVSGEVLVDRDNPQNSTIGPVEVDISQFTSDSARRDNAIRERFLESNRFPIVTFVPNQVERVPQDYQEGQQLEIQVSGDLTIRDVTKPVTFDVTLDGSGDTITGEATTMILMSDFGFGPISIGGILNTEDEVVVHFRFVARSQ